MSTRSFTQAEKQSVIAEVEARMRLAYPGPYDGACLLYALTTGMTIARRFGARVSICAGSMSWPRIDVREDDGKVLTHFSYMWEPGHPLSRAALAAGLLPELHAWVELPDTSEIVDPTTRYLVTRAQRAGLTWTASPPPFFLWVKRDDLPEGVIYKNEHDATDYVLKRLGQI